MAKPPIQVGSPLTYPLGEGSSKSPRMDGNRPRRQGGYDGGRHAPYSDHAAPPNGTAKTGRETMHESGQAYIPGGIGLTFGVFGVISIMIPNYYAVMLTGCIALIASLFGLKKKGTARVLAIIGLIVGLVLVGICIYLLIEYRTLNVLLIKLNGVGT